MKESKKREHIRLCLMILRTMDPARRDVIAQLFSDAVRLYHEMQSACDVLEIELLSLSDREELNGDPAVPYLPKTEFIVRLLSARSMDYWGFGEVLTVLGNNLGDGRLLDADWL